MGVHEGRGQLSEAMKQLRRQWSQTKSAWTDAVSDEFDETFLKPLELDARSAATAMDQMAALLSRVRQDCQ
jgi:hypothetical protein